MASDDEPIHLTPTMSPALNAKLEQLAAANCDESRDFAQSYRPFCELAYRASLKDQRLGVFNEDERLVTEIVGL
ncbi:hypothetical protein SAMN05428966_11850 [Massilia sp. PDC64]|nr:hypothetical protein [Massilia sp. PDC64]SDF63134.1 hypothetical protein SAMN05428966_11850 [Massilia sp. PDC64]